MIAFLFIFFQTTLFTGNISAAPSGHNQPEELGKVSWERNFDQGLIRSQKENKPIFLLFQEVPGCSTCRNYGHNVLSHPLIVEAIEDLFIPVAIYNNKGGEDAKVLKIYNEPSWNNPVVRIVDAEKKNLVSRVSGNYSQLGVVKAMVKALENEGLKVPTYLSLLEEELVAEKKGTETAIVSMYCFWTGEKNLGKIDGVVETQPGFMNGREVVKVEFDPAKITYSEVIKSAKAAKCASQVFTDSPKQIESAKDIVGLPAVSGTGKFRLDHQPKYYLGHTHYQYLPMTQLQASRVNSAIGNKKSPDEFLSPRQQEIASYIAANQNKGWTKQINKDFVAGWEEVEKKKK